MTAPLATTTTEHEAYELCGRITRSQARNFYYGIRLLPPGKRDALCALYALSRRIDDIGDGDQPAPVKLAALAAVRAELAAIDASSDPVLVAVAGVSRRMPVPLDAFADLVDGVEMDVLGTTYDTFDDLVLYCRRVAGSIGQLCLAVFGVRAEEGTGRSPDERAAARYADALGVALQQTNILRDIREDLTVGRVYLPREDLDRFGVRLRLDEHGNLVDDGSLSALVRFCAGRARDWYVEGMRLVPMLDRRSAACCGAMAGIYRRLLEQIAADPTAVLDRRLSLSAWQKAGVAAGALAGLS